MTSYTQAANALIQQAIDSVKENLPPNELNLFPDSLGLHHTRLHQNLSQTLESFRPQTIDIPIDKLDDYIQDNIHYNWNEKPATDFQQWSVEEKKTAALHLLILSSLIIQFKNLHNQKQDIKNAPP